ncbi:unnamed protein product [Choristocarpus tenellus]
MAKPSDAPNLRTAGFRPLTRALTQLGAAATTCLGLPALPTILEEVRSTLDLPGPKEGTGVGTMGSDGANNMGSNIGKVGGGGGGGRGGGGHVEVSRSARKRSQKVVRREREREAERNLSAASRGESNSAESAGGVPLWRGGRRGEGEGEAACASIECLSRLVLCCGANLALEGRQAVEHVVHQGLVQLSSGRGRVVGGLGGGRRVRGRSLVTNDPCVTEKFLQLAHACLMVPLVDGTRSGCLPLAVAAFRACRSHSDDAVVVASQVGLAGCDVLLHPRAAPLHLPHAITHQARAWGSERGVIGLGWIGPKSAETSEDENDGIKEKEDFNSCERDGTGREVGTLEDLQTEHASSNSRPGDKLPTMKGERKSESGGKDEDIEGDDTGSVRESSTLKAGNRAGLGDREDVLSSPAPPIIGEAQGLGGGSPGRVGKLAVGREDHILPPTPGHKGKGKGKVKVGVDITQPLIANKPVVVDLNVSGEGLGLREGPALKRQRLGAENETESGVATRYGVFIEGERENAVAERWSREMLPDRGGQEVAKVGSFPVVGTVKGDDVEDDDDDDMMSFPGIVDADPDEEDL